MNGVHRHTRHSRYLSGIVLALVTVTTSLAVSGSAGAIPPDGPDGPGPIIPDPDPDRSPPVIPGSAPLYDLPFRAEHFDPGNLVYWHRAKHSDSGAQEWGYDLAAVRYNGKWTERAFSGTENQSWLLYGKNVYAMRDGKVIACWRNAPENPPGELHPKINEGFIYGGGNGFWVEHADGTRAEYAHMIPGSVPSSLCPHNGQYMPSKIASPDVRHAWPHIRVPPEKSVAVKAGQFLGRVGNSGTSSNPHLHIHVEKGGRADSVKSGGEPVQIRFRRGLATPRRHPNLTWSRFAGQPIPPGPTLIWPPRTLSNEYARHGFPADQYQQLFDHLADSGFWPVWIDTYSVSTQSYKSVSTRSYINHVWRPAAAQWRAHHLVTGPVHQSRTDDAIRNGFSPVFVESSITGRQVLYKGRQVRYTAIFVKSQTPNIIMRHGLTVQQHDAALAAAKQRGLRPVNISVISIGGNRRYTVLYRPESIGTWQVRSRIAESDYQAIYNANATAGRRPIYLNAYMHAGQPFISAVFASKATGSRKDRHGMSASQYQAEWASAMRAGLLTHAVTSFDGARSQHRFAASWWK